MQYPRQIPELVTRAKLNAQALGFDLRPEGNRAGAIVAAGPSCCIDEAGSFLMTLAATIKQGLIGEIGTGAGVGAAWIVSGMSQGAHFNTVEIDPRFAKASTELFDQYNNIDMLCEDWREGFAAKGPYDLVFADGGGVGGAGSSEWLKMAGLLNPGGIMVIDDLTPERLWPDELQGKPDHKREFAFNSGYFIADEIAVRDDISMLLLVRR